MQHNQPTNRIAIDLVKNELKKGLCIWEEVWGKWKEEFKTSLAFPNRKLEFAGKSLNTHD
jgi:hypothetical protein